MRHGSPRVYFGFRLPVWLIVLAVPLMLAHWTIIRALRLVGFALRLVARTLRMLAHVVRWSMKPSRATRGRRGMGGGH